MRHTRMILALLVFLSASSWTSAARGGGETDEFESAYAACRSAVRRGRWSAAIEGYRRLLERFAGYSRPIQRLRIIEDELKLCHFSVQFTRPGVGDILGDAVKELKGGSRRILLDYRDGPAGPRWRRVGDFSWLLDLEFEKDLEVVVLSPGVRIERKGKPGNLDRVTPCVPVGQLTILFCYDPDEETGYLAIPGVDYSNSTHRFTSEASFVRIDKGKHQTMLTGEGVGSAIPGRFEIGKKRKELRFEGPCALNLRADDATYKKGCIAVFGVRPDRVWISGLLTRECVNDIRADFESRAFLRWMSHHWKRSRFLPPWMMTEIESRSKTFSALLPPDADAGTREETGRLFTETLFGDADSAKELEKRSGRFESRTRDYADGAIAFSKGEYESAEKSLAKLGDFPPALALRGLLRIIQGRTEEARAGLALALEAQPRSMLASYSLAHLAILDGDLERAREILDDAEREGIRSRRLTELCELVYRTLAGPLWTKTFERKTGRFLVRSNHSEKTCRRVAYALETAAESYAKFFPRPEGKKHQSRVYVFATQAGYQRYAGDLRRDLTGSAGAYDPRTRELVLFVPDQNAGFLHTIRHEGFHQFIHAALPGIPIWFNEGCAEYFAAGEKARFSARITPGAVHLPALRTLRKAFAEKVPLTRLSDLFVMSHRSFMRRGTLHYAQAWAVVHYLREGPDKELRKVFDNYVKVLRSGASAEEAEARVLAPVRAGIEDRYLQYAASLIRLHLEE